MLQDNDDPDHPPRAPAPARHRPRPRFRLTLLRRLVAGRRVAGAPVSVLVAIAAGGALGAPARYGLAQLMPTATGGFPWATFWTNVTGSLVLGFVLVLIIERFPPTRFVRPFLAVGFLGAYTTFSTFAVETDLRLKDGHGPVAVAYAVGSLVAGFAAVWAGIVAGRLMPLGGERR